MRRIADLYPGEAKTDARDAFIIADAARTMPHTLRDLAAQHDEITRLRAGLRQTHTVRELRPRNRITGPCS
jgi:hypothetical protein